MLSLGVELWRKFSLLGDKEAGIFIHEIPIRHWLRTASRVTNPLALHTCPAYRTSAPTSKKKSLNRESKVLAVSNLQCVAVSVTKHG